MCVHVGYVTAESLKQRSSAFLRNSRLWVSHLCLLEKKGSVSLTPQTAVASILRDIVQRGPCFREFTLPDVPLPQFIGG